MPSFFGLITFFNVYFLHFQAALDPSFISDVGFNQVVCIMSEFERPANMSWLTDDAYVKFFSKNINLDDADTTTSSWDLLVSEMQSILERILYVLKVALSHNFLFELVIILILPI